MSPEIKQLYWVFCSPAARITDIQKDETHYKIYYKIDITCTDWLSARTTCLDVSMHPFRVQKF